ARASVVLGRSLTSTGAVVKRAVAGFADAAPDTSLARALTLELDVEAGAGARVARAISGWRDDAELERERALAGALSAEGAGDPDRPRAEYDRAPGVDPGTEAAARAAAAHAPVADAEAPPPPEPAGDDGELTRPVPPPPKPLERSAKILAEHAQALEA